MALASGRDKKNPQFTGVLSSVDADANPTTPGPFTIHDPVGANDAGRSYLTAHPTTDLTINLGPHTKYAGPQHLGQSASDYRVGDYVRAKASPESDGVTLDARRFKLFLERFTGTLTAFSYDPPTKTGTGTVAWTSENKQAQVAGAANPLNFTLTSASKVSGHPQVDDAVELSARPSAADPSTLEAVHLSRSD
jgi:hypothetical protein